MKSDRKIFPLVVLVTGLGSCVPVVAETLRVPDIVVSATRAERPDYRNLPVVDVISRDEIVVSGARNLTELLRGRAGIHVRDLYGDGSSTSIDMRGFGGSASANTLIMVDGRKLNSSADSATLYLNAVNLDNVEQVEIIQGSSGILFGNQAVGGAINIITRRPEAARLEARAAIGSYNTSDAMLRFEDRFADGWALRLNANYRDTDNYRDHNDAELKTLSFLLEQDFEAGRFFIEHEYLDEYLLTPGALFLYEIAVDRRQSVANYAGDYIDTQSHVTRLGGEYTLNADWQFKAEVGFRKDTRDFVQSFRNFPGTLSVQRREVLDFNPRLIGSFENVQLTAGIDTQLSDYRLRTLFGPQEVEQDIVAYYLQGIVPLRANLTAVLGVRYTTVDNEINTGGAPIDLDDDVTIGSAALTWQLDQKFKLYARADQNYRFAKVDEHTNPVFGQPTGLKNQTGITYETGLEYASTLFRGTAMVYRIDLNDEISFDASGYANVNLDESSRRGAALSFERVLNDAWLVGGNYDYIDSEITAGAHEGNRVPLVPEHRVRLYAEVSLTSATRLNAEAVWVGDQIYGGDFSNQFTPLDEYTVMNLNLLYEQPDWQLSLRVNNLFNEEYAETGNIGQDVGFVSRASQNPSPERNLWLQLSFNLDVL